MAKYRCWLNSWIFFCLVSHISGLIVVVVCEWIFLVFLRFNCVPNYIQPEKKQPLLLLCAITHNVYFKTVYVVMVLGWWMIIIDININHHFFFCSFSGHSLMIIECVCVCMEECINYRRIIHCWYFNFKILYCFYIYRIYSSK
mgnify:CR=1 FL=1